MATGKNSSSPERTFSSALDSSPTRRSSDLDRREERGIWGGALEENRGPHLTAVLPAEHTPELQVQLHSARRPLLFPYAASSPSHLPSGHREKFRRTRAYAQRGTRLRRMAGP